MRKIILTLITIFFLNSCGSISTDSITSLKPGKEATFEWRFDIDGYAQINAKILDVDAFNTDKETISKWKREGKTVIAYISVGSIEDFREDIKKFPEVVIGKEYPGWNKERFLDIRRLDILGPIMEARFDMIKDKGFDGIEPDNIDLGSFDLGDKNVTGFNISIEDSKRYIDFLINEAHKRGLSIGQKNASDLAKDYADKFDWALLENAFDQGFEDKFEIYINRDKAVFAVEYTNRMDEEEFLTNVCPKAKTLKYTALLKDRNLSAYSLRCP
jgi:endo-alpha-1,4-polygalactosaminidase (GH114 family)